MDKQDILGELQAIAMARATDYLTVRDDTLQIRSTDGLTAAQAAAIASIERSTGGLKVKFYDKLKALELLGKYMGLFETGPASPQETNLLQAILAATEQEVNTCDLPELQQAAAMAQTALLAAPPARRSKPTRQKTACSLTALWEKRPGAGFWGWKHERSGDRGRLRFCRHPGRFLVRRTDRPKTDPVSPGAAGR